MRDIKQMGDLESIAHYRATLQSLHDFNRLAVHPVATSLLQPTEAEECWIVTYLRVDNCAQSLLALTVGPHFQANSMLARTMFELETDLELLEVEEDSVAKMRLYVRLEYTRAVRALVISNKLQGILDSKTQTEYLKNSVPEIEASAIELWKQSASKIQHWSAKRLPDRLKSLDTEMLQLYYSSYRLLSWNVHPGLSGYLNVPEATFNRSIARGYSLACLMYHRLLTRVVGKLALSKVDPLIGGKLEFALALPCCENETDIRQLRRDCGLSNPA